MGSTLTCRGNGVHTNSDVVSDDGRAWCAQRCLGHVNHHTILQVGVVTHRDGIHVPCMALEGVGKEKTGKSWNGVRLSLDVAEFITFLPNQNLRDGTTKAVVITMSCQHRRRWLK